jgi:hypothetical protein
MRESPGFAVLRTPGRLRRAVVKAAALGRGLFMKADADSPRPLVLPRANLKRSRCWNSRPRRSTRRSRCSCPWAGRCRDCPTIAPDLPRDDGRPHRRRGECQDIARSPDGLVGGVADPDSTSSVGCALGRDTGRRVLHCRRRRPEIRRAPDANGRCLRVPVLLAYGQRDESSCALGLVLSPKSVHHFGTSSV